MTGHTLSALPSQKNGNNIANIAGTYYNNNTNTNQQIGCNGSNYVGNYPVSGPESSPTQKGSPNAAQNVPTHPSLGIKLFYFQSLKA